MLLTHRQLQRRKHARVSKWQLYNLYGAESTYLKTGEKSTLDSKLLIILLNHISNNDKQHHTQTIFSINMITICSTVYKTKKNQKVH